MISFDSAAISGIMPKGKGAYIVGGSVRDLLLGQTPVDYDIAVYENPKYFAQRVAEKTSGRLVELGKPGQVLFRVVSKNYVLSPIIIPLCAKYHQYRQARLQDPWQPATLLHTSAWQ